MRLLGEKPTSQSQMLLYVRVGEAVCAIQHLEDCLSASIAMKILPRGTPKAEADKLLQKNRRLTLGQAIESAEGKKFFSEAMVKELRDLKRERNWLIHGGVSRHREDLYFVPVDRALLERIQSITNKAIEIYQVLQEDILNYCESNGADMSRVRAVIEEYSG